jgi:hypothetical protein
MRLLSLHNYNTYHYNLGRLFGFFIFFTFLTSSQYLQAQNTLYVDVGANGNNDGASWTNAYTNLQDAIDAANSGDEIWVAAGTYKPSAYPASCSGCINDRDYSFLLKDDIKLYGGFAGTETAISQRDFVANETILSGDFDDDDAVSGSGSTLSFTNNGENAYHVVLSVSDTPTTVLDGFNITGGNANGSSFILVETQEISTRAGGGMFNRNSSPSISNISFSGNSADINGGGMFNISSSSPSISNTSFSGNSADTGGGMHNFSSSSPSISNTSFSGNSADINGGGMLNLDSSSPSISNSSFSGNSASQGGGIFNIISSPNILNTSFSGNSASQGGGMFNIFSSSPNILNTSFSGNSASEGDGMVNQDSSSPSISNCILWGNGEEIINSSSSNSTVSFSIVEGGYSGEGTNNLDTDPLFVDAANGDLSLQLGSPAINAGNNNLYTNAGGDLANDTDLGGNPRLFDGTIDMGAFENSPCPPANILYVNNNATGNNDGSSWADAYTNLQDAIDLADACTNVNQIWVAAGTYYPTKDPFDNASPADPRDKTFYLKDGVKLYGGFDGTETAISQRDFVANETILSGDFDDDDVVTGSGSTLSFNNNGENAYHVVLSVSDSPTTVLDGFTITGGNANVNSAITVETLAISRRFGGGMFNRDSSPSISNTSFSGNSADNSGGGMYNLDSSSPSISNTSFSGNSADNSGGGMRNDSSSPSILNTSFSGNSAGDGGGMYNFASSPSILNTSFNGNSANNSGGGVYNLDSSPSITNSILWGNGEEIINQEIFNNTTNPIVSFSIVEGGYSGSNNLDTDPLFVDAANGDLSLQPGSPAINAGDNDLYTNAGGDLANDTDLGGNPRLFDGTIDMGAFENPTSCPPANILYVNAAATGNNDGSSWTDAFTNLQDAIDLADACTNVNQIWVAAGTYYPTKDPFDNATPADPRDKTFYLKDGVKLYGGFDGAETAISQRDFVANETILSGDFDDDDVVSGSGSTLSISNNGENAYHVILSVSDAPTTVIDGFTITGGNANGSSVITVETQAIFRSRGGGMFNRDSSPSISNTSFSGNSAENGGGMFNLSNSLPSILNTSFNGNLAFEGGGMYNFASSPSISNTSFSGNSASFRGGGMFNDYSSPSISNSILWGNGEEIFKFLNSNPTVSFSIVQGDYPGTNNLDQDPLFVDAANGDLSLQPGSPAINAGDNDLYTDAGGDLANDTDLSGNPRLFQSTIDVGAFEADFKQSQWRGTTSEDWATSSNWDEDVPDDQSVAVIRDMSINTPRISESTVAEASHLFIAENAVLNVNGVLKPSQRIDNDGQITFKSTEEKTGQLDEFTGTYSGSGTFEVERFVPAKRAFRLVSSSVSGQTFADAWQQDTHITGGGGASNGFDATDTNNPSLFTFNNSLVDQSGRAAWTAVTSTSEVISAGTPYRLFVRGDRSTDLTNNNALASATTLRASGEMHFGSFTPTLSSVPGNFSFVGNPYQAIVSFSSVNKSGLTDFIYLWDPFIGGNNGNGGYVTINLSELEPLLPPEIVPQSEVSNIGLTPSPFSSFISDQLAPGQAFFVQNAAASAGNITFEESDKNVNPFQLEPSSTASEFYINSRLYKTSDLQSSNTESDAIGLRFGENYTTLGSDEDASKLANPGENYVISNNGSRSIDKQNLPKPGHEVNLAILNYQDSQYSLTFDIGNQPEEYEVYLLDQYLDTKTKLSSDVVYSFSVEASNEESSDANRFKLKFEEATLSSDDFELINISLYPNPVKSTLSIAVPNSVQLNSVKLYNMIGQELKNTTTNKVDMSEFSAGVYLLELETSEGKLTKKVIKQ